jgi:hypothetical protein
MSSRWMNWGATAVLLLTFIGCRKSMPPVKPAKEPEVLNAPPMESRFSVPNYPKQAFADRDTNLLKKLDDGNVSPARGMGLMPGGGGR